MDSKKLSLGIDIGSVSIKLALLNQKNEIIFHQYRRSQGRPIPTLLGLLGKLASELNLSDIQQTGVTGSGAREIAKALNVPFYNEILTHYKSIQKLHPQTRSIVDIGGQDSKLILLEKNAKTGKLYIKDFAMNTICAAGTGSFLDQQSQRLGISIEEEFSQLALKSKKPPRIAGRCSVFAKTDMIHLQQEATPDHDIVAGLCFALTRSFKNTVAKGKNFGKPLSFQGGVAANQAMVRALAETLSLSSQELIIPKHHKCMGAIGAALMAKENPCQNWQFKQVEEVKEKLSCLVKNLNWLDGLPKPKKINQPVKKQPKPEEKSRKKEAFLGVDVGSISTNVVIIDEQGEILAKEYLMTAGRPLNAVQNGLEKVYKRLKSDIKIAGAGTTGSGRYLTGDFIGADLVKNEITAQAAAACFLDPEVDTIFEIGGQDSKYISLHKATVVDFRMNKVCAAGTGSFLEEQSQKLGIKIKDEFSQHAFRGQRACSLGERCTVFMESNLVQAQQQGAGVDELTAGLSYSIAINYLNRVVENRRVGKKIFFQGGVAYNLGVVTAFEKILGKKIITPPHHEVTGALGVALLAKEKRKAKSSFKGFLQAINCQYKLNSFECQDCSNHCKIKEVRLTEGKKFYYGNRCEKYEVNKKKKSLNQFPDFFKERETRLLSNYKKYNLINKKKKKLKIGIPYTMIFYELMPLWATFFGELGIEVVLSDKTNKNIIHNGIEKVGSETCFPVKIAHGHIINLIEKGIQYIFVPTVINMPNRHPKIKETCNCPYVQSLAYLIKSAIDLENKNIELLNPQISLGWPKANLNNLVNFALKLGASKKIAKKASQKSLEAQDSFYRQNSERGKEILLKTNKDKKIAVIAARSYNGCDEGVNLNLVKKLRELDIIPLPLDFLFSLEESRASQHQNMYWSHGQKILDAAKIISQNQNLLPVYVTNFGCGPDSFIIHFFEKEISQKPYLQLEFDEHSCDVGVITRCEAFTDSVKNWQKKENNLLSSKKEQDRQKLKNFNFSKSKRKSDYKIYVPRMGDHAFVLAAAMRRGGYQAEVFPESNNETLHWGRKYTSGKECYPCIVTTGDMVRITKRKSFSPEKSAFFMPSTNGPCRFGQYSRLQRMVLDQLGLRQVPIISPNQGKNLDKEMSFIGKTGYKEAWQAIITVDSLYKMKHRIRPYEIISGSTNKTYKECLDFVCKAVESGKPVAKVLNQIKKEFSRIKTNRKTPRPLIGIVGEIFVRNSSFCNKNLIEQIEALGGEVWLSPSSEWLFHVTKTLKAYSKMNKKYTQYVKAALAEKLQKRYEQKISSPLEELLFDRQEPNLNTIWDNCAGYLPPWFGEAALGVGKIKDLYNQGAAGVVGVMPFTCLPGNILGSVLNTLKKDCHNLPTLVLDYDGSGQTDITNRLEAFMYQALQNHKSANFKN